MLESLLTTYGYPILIVGTFLEGGISFISFSVGATVQHFWLGTRRGVHAQTGCCTC